MNHEPYLRPWEIRKCTIPEIEIYLRGQEWKPRGTPITSQEQAKAHLERERAKTPRQRLEEAIRGDDF